MTRGDRRTLVRQLAEEGLSQRAIAKRLKVSKDTVRRDLDAIAQDDAPPAEPEARDAPQVSNGDSPEGAPPGEPAARLPRRVAQPLEGIDLSQWPAVRRDLAVLAQTGSPAEVVAFRAITSVAHHYGRALAAGDIEPGQPFLVTGMTLRPMARTGATAAPPAGA